MIRTGSLHKLQQLPTLVTGKFPGIVWEQADLTDGNSKVCLIFLSSVSVYGEGPQTITTPFNYVNLRNLWKTIFCT